MTQQILFVLVVLIGAFYSRKHGNKAKSDIEKFEKIKLTWNMKRSLII